MMTKTKLGVITMAASFVIGFGIRAVYMANVSNILEASNNGNKEIIADSIHITLYSIAGCILVFLVGLVIMIVELCIRTKEAAV